MAPETQSPYDSSYYAQFRQTGRQSADVIATLVVERYQPRSVVDVGCGEGYFLDAFRDAGVAETFGVDGPFNDGVLVREHGHEFATIDLDATEVSSARMFDVAVCLEVAEHLRPQRGPALVAALVELAPVVVFSAATPLQPGQGHINTRPQSYWIEQFAAKGYRAADVIRPRIWHDERVSCWYRQNVLVYSRDEDGEVPIADLVHPGILRLAVENTRTRSGAQALRIVGSSIARRLKLTR
jgi:SAM-dependent methyltransferase